MDDLNPAENGALDAPDGTATIELNQTADDPNPEGGDDTTADTPADDTDPNDGLHPDALDETDDEPEPELTDDEIKDSSRLKTRFKDLTTKAKKAKDLEIQNAQLLKDLDAALKGAKPETKIDPKPGTKGKFTPEQLAQAKELMDELGYVPKDAVDSLKTAIKQLTTDRVSEKDRQAMHAAIDQFKDDKGQPIVSERHIQNAMRKWMQSEDPAIRNRVNMDYGAMIQLIGGSKIHGKAVKRAPAPKVIDGKGGGGKQFKPDEGEEEMWDPSDPMGSQERSISRILSAIG